MKFANIILAPMFVLLLHYFDLRMVVLFYLFMAVVFFIYKYFNKQSYKDMVIPLIYVIALSVAYYFSSFQTVKYIPVILSTIFLLLFLDAHFNKKHMILGFTKKFYKKKLSESEIEFLKHGDGYWVGVMLVNTIIHLYVVSFCSDAIWALYSSAGWYVVFFGALIAQIIYGKVYAVKMYLR